MIDVIKIVCAIVIIIIVGFVVTVVFVNIADTLSTDTKILESLADAALVRCDVSSALSDVHNHLIDDPELQRTLNMMKRGESVNAGDVRDLDRYLRNVGKIVVFDSICEVMGR